METPFLKLTTKDFLSGIAPGAHSISGGLFYKADGITPVYDPGGTASPENGLLQAGPAPTDFTSGVVVDTIFAGVETSYSGTAYLYMLGNAGHFYQKAVGAAAPTDLRSGAGSNTSFTADLTASTDVVSNCSPTVSSMNIINGSVVKYTDTDHGGLVQNTSYYVGNVSGNTFKLYSDFARASVVNLTADTSGANFQNIGVRSVITNPANGMAVWAPASGTPKLYYFMQNAIGTWDLSSTYPVGWNDAAYTITQGNNSLILKPTHQFVGNLYYGNGDVIGALTDAGSGTASHSSNVLDFPTRELVTGISDDSIYLVIATTENATSQNTYARNKVYFWDTFSASWSRDYTINDPYIWSIKNIGGIVYAFGQYGIYECSFAGGVRKVLSRLVGFGTTGDLTAGYGSSRATVYNGSALLFATDTTVDTFGKLAPDVLNAYIKGFKVSSGRPSFVSVDLDAGRVYVATTTPKLYAYDFNNGTHDTGNTAQTVYLPVPDKTQIKRVDIIFGEPLASGDAVSVSIYRDEDTSPTSFGSATFAADGAIRRKTLFKSVAAEQCSILLTFTSGAVKIKAIEVYGDPMTP